MSPFVAKRNELWNSMSGREDLSLTGRFRALTIATLARPDLTSPLYDHATRELVHRSSAP